MNGIGLLVLIAASSQVGVQHAANNRAYGWELDPEDGALCYIVQVSPETATLMQSTNQEKASDMPPELVGRATRILFRIGNGILPQNPSLEEISRLPRMNAPADVTAALEPGGSFSDVESDAVVNVQNGTPRFPPPTLPGNSFPSANTPTANQPSGDALSNLVDQAARVGGQLADQARERSRGNGSGALPLPPGSGNAPGGSIVDSLADRFSAAAGGLQDAAANAGFGNANQSTQPTLPSFGGIGQNSGTATQGIGQSQGANAGGLAFPSTTPSKFADAVDPNVTPGAANRSRQSNNWQAGTESDPRDAAARIADARNQAARGGNAPSQWPGGAGYGGGNYAAENYNRGSYAGENQGGNYDNRTPPSLSDNIFGNAIPDQRTPVEGFGVYNRNGPNTAQQRENLTGLAPGSRQRSPRSDYGGGSYAGGGYGAGGFSASNNQFPRNNAPLPGQSGSNSTNVDRIAAGGPTGSAERTAATTSGPAPNEASPSNASSASTYPPRNKTMDGVLQVFFLLSLVVNFYLGMLIRKLLARYRNLLSSVRSQAA